MSGNGQGAPVRRAAVVGAGTMGSGIAAQFANAGVPVLLLDIVPPGATDRNALAQAGIARQLKAGGFMHPECAQHVAAGNLEDDLGRVADADWIVEAIVEDVQAKRDLYRRIDAVRRPGTIVSSNTSTILRSALVEGMGEGFASSFLITHFFNPPRYMRLLEFVAADGVQPHIVQRAREAGEVVLGKTVIDCRDTPGFIANRLGCYWMSVATLEALAAGLSPEEADAVAGRPFGVPPTGIFGLLDLVGIDLIPNVWGSLYRALPAGDPFQAYDLPGNEVVRAMIAAGRIGRKAGAGFYRQQGSGPDRRSEVYDHAANAYRPARTVDRPADLASLCERNDAVGRYAWRVLSRLVSYSAWVGPGIAADVATIDTAMKLGYAWNEGPFGLADRVGVERIAARLRAEGEPVPELLAQAAARGGFYADRGRRHLGTDGLMRTRRVEPAAISVADATSGRTRVADNEAATVWDVGQGLACLELATRGNVPDLRALDIVAEAAQSLPRSFRALVIASDRPFGAGGELFPLIEAIEAKRWSAIEAWLRAGQSALSALRASPIPVVAAAHGAALAGGAQLLLHCDEVVAHAELGVGLTEATAGVVPGWGGCLRLLARRSRRAGAGRGPGAVGASVFDLLAHAVVSRSAPHAKEAGHLLDTDTIVMHADRVYSTACDRALALAEAGYVPPVGAPLFLAGRSGKAALMNFVLGNAAAGRAGPHDVAVCDALAGVVTGGDTDPLAGIGEEAILGLERDAFVALAQTPGTLARLRHLRDTGRALRN